MGGYQVGRAGLAGSGEAGPTFARDALGRLVSEHSRPWR